MTSVGFIQNLPMVAKYLNITNNYLYEKRRNLRDSYRY